MNGLIEEKKKEQELKRKGYILPADKSALESFGKYLDGKFLPPAFEYFREPGTFDSLVNERKGEKDQIREVLIKTKFREIRTYTFKLQQKSPIVSWPSDTYSFFFHENMFCEPDLKKVQEAVNFDLMETGEPVEEKIKEALLKYWKRWLKNYTGIQK